MLPVIITHEELLVFMGRTDKLLGRVPRSICAADDGPRTDPVKRERD